MEDIITSNQFQAVEIANPTITLPEDFKRMFADMESLKNFIASRMIHEASMSIMKQVNEQLKGVDYYE